MSGDPLSATWAGVRRIALALPGVEEGTSYGTPAFHVKKKFLLRLKEDGRTIALKIGFEDARRQAVSTTGRRR